MHQVMVIRKKLQHIHGVNDGEWGEAAGHWFVHLSVQPWIDLSVRASVCLYVRPSSEHSKYHYLASFHYVLNIYKYCHLVDISRTTA